MITVLCTAVCTPRLQKSCLVLCVCDMTLLDCHASRLDSRFEHIGNFEPSTPNSHDLWRSRYNTHKHIFGISECKRQCKALYCCVCCAYFVCIVTCPNLKLSNLRFQNKRNSDEIFVLRCASDMKKAPPRQYRSGRQRGPNPQSFDGYCSGALPESAVMLGASALWIVDSSNPSNVVQNANDNYQLGNSVELLTD